MGFSLSFFLSSGKNLQSILCQNKPKLLPNSHPEVELFMQGRYRCTEHQKDSINGNWESSGATEHPKECHQQFNWIHPRTMAIMSNMCKRTVCEALEINRFKTLNR